jgi:phage gp16-like protein
VYDAALINAVADAVDDRRNVARLAGKGKLGTCKAVSGERAALVKIAAVVEGAKAAGYSQIAAEGLIGQGEFRASQRASMVNGATGTDTPALPEAHVKFDGPKDRRRQRRQDETLGNKYAIPTAFWTAENGDGPQEASLKDDAADTGEWFG